MQDVFALIGKFTISIHLKALEMQCLNKTKLKLIIFNGYDYGYLVVPKRKIFIWSAGRNGSDEILLGRGQNFRGDLRAQA